MSRLRAAAARALAAAALALRARRRSLGIGKPVSRQAVTVYVLPPTPPPPPRRIGPWRPRIHPELRTLRERVVIYYVTADVPVAATLALAGWPVGDVL